MTKWTERSMGSWVRLGMCLAVLPLIASMAIVHFLVAHRALGAFDDVASRYRDEQGPVNELRVDLWEAGMAVEAYLEERQGTQPGVYRERRVAIEGRFAQLHQTLASDRAMAALLARAQEDWTAADRVAMGLLVHPSAPGDAHDAALESELDGYVQGAADKLRAINDQIGRAVSADHRDADRASERALWVSGLAALISLLMIAAGVTVISRIMLRNVQRLVDGARKFAAGDREHRIEIGVPPELREVADELHRMIDKIGEAEEALEQQARRDPLTGLDNRRAFDEAIQQSMARMRRYGEQFYVATLDVDYFKKVNDTHGHAAGDEVLCAVSSTIKSTIREVDRAFRIGGEEFVVLLTDVDAPGALVATDRLRKRIANRVVSTGGVDLQVTASFGLAQAMTTSTPAELLRAADTALYAAKANGRNRIEAAPPFPMPITNATA